MKPQHLKTLPLVLAALLAAGAQPARATLLSDLIGLSQSIQVGDLIFDNFSYSSLGDMPLASAIDVSTYSAPGGSLGLTFMGTFLDMPGGNASNALIGYHVTSITPGVTITSASLMGNTTVIGGTGVASVTETFLPTDPVDTLNVFSIAPGSTSNLDSLTFASPYSSLVVQDSVLMISTGGMPMLSFVTPSFQTSNTPIPEPASVVLLGLGLGTLGLRYVRRK